MPRLEPLISFKVPFGNSLHCLGDQFTAVATTFADSRPVLLREGEALEIKKCKFYMLGLCLFLFY